MTEVKEAILKEISVLECSWSSPKGPSTTSTTLLTNNSGCNISTPHQGTNKSACVFCKGLHFSGRCETVRDAQKRLEIAKKGKLCFNCLGHHRASQCPSKTRCKSCRQEHHTSLCGADFSSKSPEVPQSLHAPAQLPKPPVAAQTITTQTTHHTNHCDKTNNSDDSCCASRTSQANHQLNLLAKNSSCPNQCLGITC